MCDRTLWFTRPLVLALLIVSALVQPSTAAQPGAGAVTHGSPALHQAVARASQSDPSGRMASAREALDSVLARPEFQRSAMTVWADQMRTRLSRWMADVLERMGAGRIAGRRAAKVLAWVVGLGALAALAWWLVRSLIRSPERAEVTFAPGASRRRSARAWARDALAAHRDGNEREAARCSYHAALAQLEEHGAWHPDESRTPREYLDLLPRDHRHHSLLADITGRFEQVWYGAGRPAPDDSRAVLARLKELGCLPSDQAI